MPARPLISPTVPYISSWRGAPHLHFPARLAFAGGNRPLPGSRLPELVVAVVLGRQIELTKIMRKCSILLSTRGRLWVYVMVSQDSIDCLEASMDRWHAAVSKRLMCSAASQGHLQPVQAYELLMSIARSRMSRKAARTDSLQR